MDNTLTPAAQPPQTRPGTLESRLTIGLLERVRLIMRGGSVVDWYRLGFETEQEVVQFLRTNGYDLSDPADEARLRQLFESAASYLHSDMDTPVPEALWNPESVLEPFLIASLRQTSSGKLHQQRIACILLKIVHTLNHLEARELRMHLPLSDKAAFDAVAQGVDTHMTAMAADGYPVVQFTSSRKSRRSTITKLLSKRRANAAQILDRLRFRVIVHKLHDVPLVLAEMTRRFLPFNYVVPEETTNLLMNFRDYAQSLSHLKQSLDALQFDLNLEKTLPLSADPNECSAREFRMLNFVADIPIRLGAIMTPEQLEAQSHLGRIIFVNAEFQMFDHGTWESNEASSTSNHEAYKRRQRERVKARLFRGLDSAARGD
ncbi:MAG: hypothetical protein ACI9OJ_005895 [Myxococcota bacterium]|jgi:uncharacterized protein (TIGR04552 family)